MFYSSFNLFSDRFSAHACAFIENPYRYTVRFVILSAQSNLTHLPRHEYVPGVGLGTAKCPYDPLDNSTAIWSEKGNPGQLPALYSGTNAEFTKADTVIFRTDLFNLTTGRKEFAFKRTLKYDSNWLDSEYTRQNTFRTTAYRYVPRWRRTSDSEWGGCFYIS